MGGGVRGQVLACVGPETWLGCQAVENSVSGVRLGVEHRTQLRLARCPFLYLFHSSGEDTGKFLGVGSWAWGRVDPEPLSSQRKSRWRSAVASWQVGLSSRSWSSSPLRTAEAQCGHRTVPLPRFMSSPPPLPFPIQKRNSDLSLTSHLYPQILQQLVILAAESLSILEKQLMDPHGPGDIRVS